MRVYGPDVLDGARLGEERVDDSDGLGPVPRAAELGQLNSLGDSRGHELTRTSLVALIQKGQLRGLSLGSFLRFNGFKARERD